MKHQQPRAIEVILNDLRHKRYIHHHRLPTSDRTSESHPISMARSIARSKRNVRRRGGAAALTYTELFAPTTVDTSSSYTPINTNYDVKFQSTIGTDPATTAAPALPAAATDALNTPIKLTFDESTLSQLSTTAAQTSARTSSLAVTSPPPQTSR